MRCGSFLGAVIKRDMMLMHLVIGLLLLFAATGEGESNAEVKHWGLIVAGSNYWYNYRHQVVFGMLQIFLSVSSSTKASAAREIILSCNQLRLNGDKGILTRCYNEARI